MKYVAVGLISLVLVGVGVYYLYDLLMSPMYYAPRYIKAKE